MNAEEILVVGILIGTGPASLIAQQINAKKLLLVTPYTSLRDVVGGRRLVEFLRAFLEYYFPTAAYINQLHGSCIIAVHGIHDQTIPVEHTERLSESTQSSRFYKIISEMGSYESVFFNHCKEIDRLLSQCNAP